MCVFIREPLDIKKYGLVFTAKMDLPSPCAWLSRRKSRHQGIWAGRRHQREYRVFEICGLFKKIKARGKTLQKTTSQNGNIKMGCLQIAARMWYSTRLYGFESAGSIRGSRHAPETTKRGVEGFLLGIFRMVILALRVSLPQFNHCIGHGSAIAIQYLTDEPTPLAFCFRPRQAADGSSICQAEVQIRTNGLRRGGNEIHVISQMAWQRGHAGQC